jgi:hypothetical protein
MEMVRVSSKIRRIAQAIARAEGYGVPGAIPTVRNNPGNIRDSSGAIATYPTPAEGWQALYRQVLLMLTGESRFYKPEMTIAEIARVYTGEAAYMNWANNVSKVLGVTPDTRLRDV